MLFILTSLYLLVSTTSSSIFCSSHVEFFQVFHLYFAVLNYLGFLYIMLFMSFLPGKFAVIIKYHPYIELIMPSIINALIKNILIAC